MKATLRFAPPLSLLGLLCLGALLLAPSAMAAPTPETRTPIMDAEQLFTSSQTRAIAASFQHTYDSTRVAPVLETHIFPGKLSSGALKIWAVKRANALGVGNVATNNGLYMVLDGKNHQFYAATGLGVEKVVASSTVQRLVDDATSDHFKKGDYPGGVENVASGVGYAYTHAGALSPQPKQAKGKSLSIPWGAIFTWIGSIVGGFIILSGLVWALGIPGRRRQAEARARLAAEAEKKQAAEKAEAKRLRGEQDSLRRALQTHWAEVEAAPDGHGRNQVLTSVGQLIKLTPDQQRRVLQEEVMSALSRRLNDLSGSLRAEYSVPYGIGKDESLAKGEARIRSLCKLALERQTADEQASKDFWDALSPEERAQVKRASSKSDKQRVITRLGTERGLIGNGGNFTNNLLWLYLWESYSGEIGKPETHSPYSSSSSSSSYSSTPSYSPSYTFDSSGGGSFGGGGGGSSW